MLEISKKWDGLYSLIDNIQLNYDCVSTNKIEIIEAAQNMTEKFCPKCQKKDLVSYVNESYYNLLKYALDSLNEKFNLGCHIEDKLEPGMYTIVGNLPFIISISAHSYKELLDKFIIFLRGMKTAILIDEISKES